MPLNEVYCPMYGRRIAVGLCFDAQMVADGDITQDPDPALFVTDEMRIVCKSCPKREDPAAEVNGKV
jgi:hypothetical protein